MQRVTPGGGSTPLPPPGVVFDCDGVLVDSEPLHARATTEWARSIGVHLPPEFFPGIVGKTVREQVALIVDGTGHPIEDGLRDREEHFWAVAHEIMPMTGVQTLIRRLNDAGSLVAIASNGSRRYLEHVIDLLDVRGLIEIGRAHV